MRGVVVTWRDPSVGRCPTVGPTAAGGNRKMRRAAVADALTVVATDEPGANGDARARGKVSGWHARARSGARHRNREHGNGSEKFPGGGGRTFGIRVAVIGRECGHEGPSATCSAGRGRQVA